MKKSGGKRAEKELLTYLRSKGRDIKLMKLEARKHLALSEQIQARFPRPPLVFLGGDLIAAQPEVSSRYGDEPLPDTYALANTMAAWIKGMRVSIQLDEVTWQVGEVAELKLIIENRTMVAAEYLSFFVHDETGCAEMVAADGVTTYGVHILEYNGLTEASGSVDYFPQAGQKELHLFAKAIKPGRPRFAIRLSGPPDMYTWWFWKAETRLIVPD